MGGRKLNIITYLALFTAVSMLICILAFTMLGRNQEIGMSLMFNFLINFPMCVLICLMDYKLIQWRNRKNHLRNGFNIMTDWILSLLAGIVALLLIRWLTGYDNDVLGGVLTFIVWNSITILGIELYLFQRSILEKEALMARMEKEKATYQFEALKNQMNPHFLFNSLNALASLAWQDAEKTNRFAKKLSGVYRYLLTTYDRPLVTLKEELDFLNAYLYLEHIRFGDAFQVSITVNESDKLKKLVPASIQMQVENALKHNIATEEHPLQITITSSGGKILVSNPLQLRDGVATNKVGSENLQRQYRIYGLEIRTERVDGIFKVEIPLLS